MIQIKIQISKRKKKSNPNMLFELPMIYQRIIPEINAAYSRQDSNLQPAP